MLTVKARGLFLPMDDHQGHYLNFPENKCKKTNNEQHMLVLGSMYMFDFVVEKRFTFEDLAYLELLADHVSLTV